MKWGGYWVAEQPVESLEQITVHDLLGQHVRARIELRITPSIWPFWRRVVDSTGATMRCGASIRTVIGMSMHSAAHAVRAGSGPQLFRSTTLWTTTRTVKDNECPGRGPGHSL